MLDKLTLLDKRTISTSFIIIKEMSLYLLLGIFSVPGYQVEAVIGQEAAVSSVANTSFVCRTEGRFPHLTKCGGFVDCVAGVEGEPDITPTHHTCPHSSTFHPTRGICVPHYEAPWCLRSDVDHLTTNSIKLPADGRGFGRFPSPSALTRSPKHDALCARNLGFACASCIHLVVCAGSEAYLESCASSMRCMTHAPFPGGVCYPLTPHHQHCVCQEAGQRLQDPYDYRAYLMCPSANGEPELVYCPDNLEFNFEFQNCIRPPAFPECVSAGVFPLLTSCNWYYTCLPDEGTDRWRQYHARCPVESQVYSRVTGGCENPEDLSQEDPCNTQQQKKRSRRYTCTFWQLLFVTFFPEQIPTVCTPV